MILKVTRKQGFTHSLQNVYFLKYIFRVNVRILNEISILVFANLAIFHSI